MELAEERLLFDDQLPERPVKLVLAPVDVTLGNLSSEHGSVSTLAFSAGWNGKGQLKADGTFSLWRPSADLTLHVRALDLPSIDPYLSLYGNLDARLGDGRLTIEGHVRVDLQPDPLAYNFEGDVSVDASVAARLEARAGAHPLEVAPNSRHQGDLPAGSLRRALGAVD